MVSKDRRSLITGFIEMYRAFCLEYLIFQDRWSLIAVVSQDSFHCIRVIPGWKNIKLDDFTFAQDICL